MKKITLKELQKAQRAWAVIDKCDSEIIQLEKQADILARLDCDNIQFSIEVPKYKQPEQKTQVIDSEGNLMTGNGSQLRQMAGRPFMYGFIIDDQDQPEQKTNVQHEINPKTGLLILQALLKDKEQKRQSAIKYLQSLGVNI